MQSFRTELEDLHNPVVEKEIIDLDKKIRLFQEGKIDETKFKSLRLARGVYGQRQPGVQMVRIKLPFGKINFKQIVRIADLSDEYASKKLHFTTRQDVQIHYVSLDKTPELWVKLAEDDITLREACGNTVRNVTASPNAGIDKDEPFDISPYAQAMFEFFVRNPICQDMGRKFKIAFSSSEKDTAFTFIHDLGFIPKVKFENGQEIRGFKVMLGGGLGAQPLMAHVIEEFLPEDQMIPLTESVIRVFDRYGERNNRNKARFKYLLQKLGLEDVLKLVAEERIANKSTSFHVNTKVFSEVQLSDVKIAPSVEISDKDLYEKWIKSNVYQQKQEDFYCVYVKVLTGDMPSEQARAFANALEGYVADDIRITQNQGLLLKYVRKENLPYVFEKLSELGLATPGFDSITDITTCPGTDTCNLGISNSTEMAKVLEDVLYKEYPELIYNHELKIKISGCMNSCGQHGLAEIGFHGSSIKVAGKIVPAVQVMLGGGSLGDGLGRASERVIKVPTKRAPQVLRALLNDFGANAQEEETFKAYYDRNGKDYFYQLLKPIADQSTLTEDEFIDWGQYEDFKTEIGVGECAGVVVDLVATLLYESEEKLVWAHESFDAKSWADSIYHSYNIYIGTAKALLLSKSITSNTQAGIIKEFDANFVASGEIVLPEGYANFADLVLQINKNQPTEEFAKSYLDIATLFYSEAKKIYAPQSIL
ncbi:nitrite reductase [Rhizosphaericola mali]|uniref:Nitrite reductase n=1 Tax=Rhizosphaericola mali TaxID=2545455 RepID=A0A5P2G3Z3_9BACT|nr:nitrite reductase [Rhizosphaericola mali]QES88470.1 nitrite reductase [Rhizosphaericola mali]